MLDRFSWYGHVMLRDGSHVTKSMMKEDVGWRGRAQRKDG